MVSTRYPIDEYAYFLHRWSVFVSQSALVWRYLGVKAMVMASTWVEADFENIFREHFERLVRIARRVLHDGAEAEEVCADTFLKLYRKGPGVLAGGTVGAWLYRVATRASIDRLRRNRRCRPREEQEEFDTNEQNLEVDRDDPLNQLMRDERIASIRSALALLKPEKAQILLLRHSGLSYLEIAVVMQISAGSVGTMLARAEANFSALYQRQQERGRREPRLQPAKEGR